MLFEADEEVITAVKLNQLKKSEIKLHWKISKSALLENTVQELSPRTSGIVMVKRNSRQSDTLITKINHHLMYVFPTLNSKSRVQSTIDLCVLHHMSTSDSPPAKKHHTSSIHHEITLYSYWRSSCSWRVRTALQFKRLSYEYKAVHLVLDGGQQHNPEFVRDNPMRQVPLLVVKNVDQDGIVGEEIKLSQSMAILEFLEEMFPEPQLLPEKPRMKIEIV